MMDYRRHVDAFINGVSLQTAAPMTVIQEITEAEAETDIVLSQHPRTGQRLGSRRRKAKEIRITAVIGNQYDLEARARQLDLMAAWAQDGMLKVSYRPGEHLRVKVKKRPPLGAVREWTQPMEFIFAAYEIPYWEDDEAEYVWFENVDNVGSEVSGSISLAGSAPYVPLNCVFVVAEGTLNQLQVRTPAGAMTLSNVNVPAGNELRIEHAEEDHHLIIRCGSSSRLACRTADSADDLLVVPGAPTDIAFTADTTVQLTASGRGLWA